MHSPGCKCCSYNEVSSTIRSRLIKLSRNCISPALFGIVFVHLSLEQRMSSTLHWVTYGEVVMIGKKSCQLCMKSEWPITAILFCTEICFELPLGLLKVGLKVGGGKKMWRSRSWNTRQISSCRSQVTSVAKSGSPLQFEIAMISGIVSSDFFVFVASWPPWPDLEDPKRM